MDKWTTVPLGSLGADDRSAFATGPFGSAVSANNFQESGVPMIRGSNLSDDVAIRLDDSDLVFVSEELASKFARSIVTAGDLVFTCWGTIGQVGLVDESARYVRYIVSNKQMKMSPDRNRVSPLFLYYYLSQPSMVALMQGQAIGSSVPGFNLGQLKSLPVTLPQLDDQLAIADVLGSLDDKITINARALELSARLAEARYLAALDAGKETFALGEIAEFHNRRRIPLSSRERESRPGKVPYYGAAGRVGFVDEPIFDGQFILVGEDGTVMREDGRPVVQYIWGPAWVNNHAHVLTGKQLSTEFLGVALRFANVAHLVTGAVQPKLSMGRLRMLNLELPNGADALDAEIGRQFALHRAISGENDRLSRARDELLPLLMSGRIQVKDAERVVEEVV